MGHRQKNIGKLKPSPADIAIGIGIYGIGELVDFVMDPDNNRPKRKISCEVGFGDDKLSLTQYAGLSRQRKDAYGNYIITANSDTYETLRKIEQNMLKRYESGSYGSHKDWSNVENTSANWDVTRIINGERRVGKGDFAVSVHVRCLVPELDTKPSPSPSPKPSDNPAPSDNPNNAPDDKPKPNPQDEPNPEPQPKPEPSPNPSPSDNPAPSDNPNNAPSDNPNKDNPSPSPSPTTPPDVAPNDVDGGGNASNFELPAFCSWASKVCNWIDWTMQDDDFGGDHDLDIEDKPLTKSPNDFDVMYLRFGGQCPAPVTHNLGLNNATFTIDLTPLCQFAILVRPAILAMAYFLAIGIIANAIRDT